MLSFHLGRNQFRPGLAEIQREVQIPVLEQAYADGKYKLLRPSLVYLATYAHLELLGGSQCLWLPNSCSHHFFQKYLHSPL